MVINSTSAKYSESVRPPAGFPACTGDPPPQPSCFLCHRDASLDRKAHAPCHPQGCSATRFPPCSHTPDPSGAPGRSVRARPHPPPPRLFRSRFLETVSEGSVFHRSTLRAWASTRRPTAALVGEQSGNALLAGARRTARPALSRGDVSRSQGLLVPSRLHRVQGPVFTWSWKV